jgi:hypothetical protein
MSEPSLPTTPTEKRDLKRTAYERKLTPATAEKQRYGKDSTIRRGRPKTRPEDDGQSLEEFFATPTMSQEKKQMSSELEPQINNSHQHAHAEETPYEPHLNYRYSSPYLYPRPDSPNYADIPSSPPIFDQSPSCSPTRNATFRRHAGSPRAPYTRPPTLNPQYHDDWLHRNLVGKNIVSSPDKLAAPLTEDLPRIPILPVEQFSLVQRIKFVNQCLVNAGFPRAGDYLLTLMTETFDSHQKAATNKSKKCTNLQLHEWTWGLPNLLKNLDEFISTRIHNSAWAEKLELYKENVVDSASTVLESEFRRFAVREDTRRLDPSTRTKQRQDISNPNVLLVPSYLQLRASEVTPELLAANIMAETQKQFQTEASDVQSTIMVWTYFD